MRVVENFPRKVREIVNTFIPMSDGAKLAARIWLPEDAEKNPVPAILEYLPYRKRDGDGTANAGRADAPLFRRPRLCRRARRSARLRRVRRHLARRVHQAGTRRLPGGAEMAGGAALVHRRLRHDRHLLGRLQRAAGGGAAAAGTEGGDHALLHRRPLCRRHPRHGRLHARGQSGLGLGDVRHPGPPARSGAGGRALARDVDSPPGEPSAAGGQLAGASAARRHVEAWLGLREL